LSDPAPARTAARPERRAAGKLGAIARDLRILQRFLRVYCEKHHAPPRGELCHECRDLLEYARTRLDRCPYDPKPKCKECPTHCYEPARRARVRQVMKFSGMHFVKRGRLDWLVRYFWSQSMPIRTRPAARHPPRE
jgi:hypothetical protein